MIRTLKNYAYILWFFRWLTIFFWVPLSLFLVLENNKLPTNNINQKEEAKKWQHHLNSINRSWFCLSNGGPKNTLPSPPILSEAPFFIFLARRTWNPPSRYKIQVQWLNIIWHVIDFRFVKHPNQSRLLI